MKIFIPNEDVKEFLTADAIFVESDIMALTPLQRNDINRQYCKTRNRIINKIFEQIRENII